MRLRSSSRITLLLVLFCAVAHVGHAETVDVTAQIRVIRPGKHVAQTGSAGVVVWLTPTAPDLLEGVSAVRPGHYRLTQKDKQFTPHLLVIPTGSTVDFPNLDPFFHNVFSLFNGKRFDLGLYESGSVRTVHFDHDGISYIFCNIHPEMSAVIITLSTPYYEVSPSNGNITLQRIPPGTYQMSVWAEGGNTQTLTALSRRVQISPAQRDLGTVTVTVDSHFHPHKNKFGEDYQEPIDSLY